METSLDLLQCEIRRIQVTHFFGSGTNGNSIGVRVTILLSIWSRTSSDVELMETDTLGVYPVVEADLVSRSRTSSEVELMETSEISAQNLEVSRHALLRKWN